MDGTVQRRTAWLALRILVDRVIALVGAVLLAPVMGLLAVLVKRQDGGPAFIRVRRVGRHGREFGMWKLRSMRADADGGRAAGARLTGAHDDRITPLGQRLRSYHLDELPQLLNVAAGQMLLLGPRPEDPRYVDRTDPRWAEVLSVPPGIAGPTQLVVGEWERRVISKDESDTEYQSTVLPVKLAIDRWYLRTASPITDAFVAATLARRFLPGTEAWTLKHRVYESVPESQVVREYHLSRRRRARRSGAGSEHLHRPIPNPYVWTVEVDGEVVAYDALNDWAHLLNGPAAAIWELCDGSRTLDEIAAKLAGESGGDPATVLADVEDLTLSLDAGGTFIDADDSHPGDLPTHVDRIDPFPLTPPPPGVPLSPAALDRSRWKLEAGPFDALGFRFSIRSQDEELGRFLASIASSLVPNESRWATLAAADETHVFSILGRAADRFDLYLDSEYAVTSARDGVPMFVTTIVNQQAVLHTKGHLLIHAAAVERDGQVIVLPGPSGSGKSTLAAELCASFGFAYVTDEIVAINESSGEVRPYPKALHLEPGSWAVLPQLKPAGASRAGYEATKWYVGPQRFLLSNGGPIGTIAFPSFNATSGQNSGADVSGLLVPCSNVQATVSLLGNALNVHVVGPQGLSLASRLVNQAAVFQLTTMSDVSAAAHDLEALLGRHAIPRSR